MAINYKTYVYVMKASFVEPDNIKIGYSEKNPQAAQPYAY